MPRVQWPTFTSQLLLWRHKVSLPGTWKLFVFFFPQHSQEWHVASPEAFTHDENACLVKSANAANTSNHGSRWLRGHGTTVNSGEAGQSTLTGHSLNKKKKYSNSNWSSTQWLGHLLPPGDVGGFLSPDSRQSAGSSASTEELLCIKQLLGDARSVLDSWCSWWFILILQGPLQVHNEKVNQWEVNADNLQRGLTLNAKHPSEAVKLWGQRWVCGRVCKTLCTSVLLLVHHTPFIQCSLSMTTALDD